jgi:hypothetical protein
MMVDHCKLSFSKTRPFIVKQLLKLVEEKDKQEKIGKWRKKEPERDSVTDIDKGLKDKYKQKGIATKGIVVNINDKRKKRK